jgi:hypothetical protein
MTWNNNIEKNSMALSVARTATVLGLFIFLLTVNRLTNWNDIGFISYYPAPIGLFFMKELEVFTVCAVVLGTLGFGELIITYVKVNDYKLMNHHKVVTQKSTLDFHGLINNVKSDKVQELRKLYETSDSCQRCKKLNQFDMCFFCIKEILDNLAFENTSNRPQEAKPE